MSILDQSLELMKKNRILIASAPFWPFIVAGLGVGAPETFMVVEKLMQSAVGAGAIESAFIGGMGVLMAGGAVAIAHRIQEFVRGQDQQAVEKSADDELDYDKASLSRGPTVEPEVKRDHLTQSRDIKTPRLPDHSREWDQNERDR